MSIQNCSLDVLYNKNITSAQDDRTLEEWSKHEGRCHSRQTVAKVAKIFVISLCFYAFDIAFSLFIYQIENTNNCITLLKGGWSLGAQEDRTALYKCGTEQTRKNSRPVCVQHSSPCP